MPSMEYGVYRTGARACGSAMQWGLARGATPRGSAVSRITHGPVQAVPGQALPGVGEGSHDLPVGPASALV
jgi:hypothetical protein